MDAVKTNPLLVALVLVGAVGVLAGVVLTIVPTLLGTGADLAPFAGLLVGVGAPALAGAGVLAGVEWRLRQ